MEQNQTLFVANLPTNMDKNKLKQLLYYHFTPHTRVGQIICTKATRPNKLKSTQGSSDISGDKYNVKNSMRGQAFIVCHDVQGAENAMLQLNGTQFLGRVIRIEYARSNSHIVDMKSRYQIQQQQQQDQGADREIEQHGPPQSGGDSVQQRHGIDVASEESDMEVDSD
ncbi:hypothetical protein MP228_008018 [Amoeboaphelidium protococcarum]|nr:hypothetical protein MP228_008018 [Amoeboaphelidium protococcarum]